MDDNQNLPTLQDKRLSYISRITRRTRKMTSILNDSLSRKNTIYEKCMNREQRNYDFRSWQRTQPFQESLVHVRSTQRCLKKHKIGDCFVNTPEFNYGIYGGMPLRALRYEILETKKEAHPRERRLREVKRLLTNGKEDGRLVNYDNVQKTFNEIINRNYPSSVNDLTWSPTGYNFEDHSANELRLPPIAVSRENTKELLRPKSVVVGSRYKTFMFEPATTRF